MDNLTQIKKNRLLQESKDKILETPLFHNDIMKMYAYIYDCTVSSDTLAEIQLMETVKSSLDFLVRGIIVYIEVTCCDSKGDVKKGIDRLESISDDLIGRVLRAYHEYYTVIAWEIWLVPKKEKENAKNEI